MSEVNLGIDLRFLWVFEQVCSVWKGIVVFLLDLLSPQKSTHNRSEPSFFQANRTGAPWGDKDGRINPVSRLSSINFREPGALFERASKLDRSEGWSFL
jgi:hypothetical protein